MEQKVVNLTTASFDQAIAQGTWLIDFWATWCAPCRMQGKLIDDHIDELAAIGATVGKVNVDAEQELAAQFGIMSIPTLLVFKNGQKVNESLGLIPKEQVEKLID